MPAGRASWLPPRPPPLPPSLPLPTASKLSTHPPTVAELDSGRRQGREREIERSGMGRLVEKSTAMDGVHRSGKKRRRDDEEGSDRAAEEESSGPVSQVAARRGAAVEDVDTTGRRRWRREEEDEGGDRAAEEDSSGPVSQVAARRGEDVDTTRRRRTWRRLREEEEEGRDAAAEESGSAASSKRQRGDLASQVDRLSALPEELRTCILRFLPLSTAMLLSALSGQWRDIWKRRWELLDGQPSSLSYHLLPGVYPSPDELLSLLMKAQHRGLNSFSLIVETSDMTPDLFNSILSRAADFHAGEICIEIRPRGLGPILFHFEAYTAHLCRLSLTNIRISGLHLESGDSFTSLVCLQLCHVGISDTILARIVALSPSLLVLHVLEIEYLQEIALGTASSKLRTLTIMGCKWVTRVDVGALNTLQCFRYSGPYSSLCFSAHTLINDIYVRFEGSSDHSFKWLEAMPDFSNLTVMTICDIALPVVSGLHLQKVSEMQLILRTLDSTITGQIHELLSMCACQLKKLFMQLPTGSDYLGELEGDERLEGAPQLEKLVLIKVLNFDGDGAQMVLLRSLLLKAPGLAKLLLIGRRRGELQEHQVLDDLTTAQIVLRKDDDTDTELVHSRESVLDLHVTEEGQ